MRRSAANEQASAPPALRLAVSNLEEHLLRSEKRDELENSYLHKNRDTTKGNRL